MSAVYTMASDVSSDSDSDSNDTFATYLV